MRQSLAYLTVIIGLLLPTSALALNAQINWVANSEPDLKGYNVRYGTAPGVYTGLKDAGNAISTTVLGLAENTTYYFVVTAYDLNGNESPHSVEVAIDVPNTTPPVVFAPTAITVEATGPTTVVALGTATANDPETGPVAVTADITGPFSVGITTVTWSASDNFGNTASATQSVTVTDTTGPAISAAAITLEATGPNTGVDLTGVSATDLVDGLVVTPTTLDPTGPFGVGTHTIRWTAQDSRTNSTTLAQIITITDTTAPTLVAANISVEADLTVMTTAVNLTGVTGSDVVDGTLTPTTLDPTGPFTRGTHTINWTLTDNAGNTTSAVQTITITDTTAPVAPTGLNILIP